MRQGNPRLTPDSFGVDQFADINLLQRCQISHFQWVSHRCG